MTSAGGKHREPPVDANRALADHERLSRRAEAQRLPGDAAADPALRPSTDPPLLSLETLAVQGTPRDMGGAQGEHFRERIQSFLDMHMRAVSAYLAERQGPSLASLRDIGARSFEVFAGWDPEGHAEQSAIAEAAHVSPVALHTVVEMTDLRDALLLSAPAGTPKQPPAAGARPSEAAQAADAEGCSVALIPASMTADRQAIVGQTWDLNPPDVDYVVAIHRKPRSGPQTWSVTCTGCLSLIGINSSGLALGTTNIKTYGSRPGVGYIAILHRALRSSSLEEAKQRVQTAPHAGAHTYWLADAQLQCELECSPNGHEERRVGALHGLARTNHCLSALHVGLQGELPNESSQRRLARLESRLGVRDGGHHEESGEMSDGRPDAGAASEHAWTVADMRDLFADRSDGVHSVNRYAEDGQGTATNAVFIAVPAERRAWACRGPADRGAFRSLSFDASTSTL